MLQNGTTSTREVAQTVGCSERLVRHVRQQLGIRYPGESLSRQVDRLDAEIGELWRMVRMIQGKPPRQTYVFEPGGVAEANSIPKPRKITIDRE